MRYKEDISVTSGDNMKQLDVVHPKIIHFTWKFVRRIIQYITMYLSIYFLKKKDIHV